MPADTTHVAIPQPPDPALAIWRYMDFAKYVAMLKSRSIHFSRLDLLGDPFEGSLSKGEYEHWKAVAAAGESGGRLPDDWRGRYFDVLMGNARRARRECYVSCWHMNSSESEAMWRLYSASGYAIAVRSTYGRLTHSLPTTFEPDEHLGPFIGVVRYADHHLEELPRGNIFHAIMSKRRSFAHEQECRAIVWRAGPSRRPDPIPDEIVAGYPPGVSVPVDLDCLVERVVISPSAPSWFSDIVADVTSKYGFSLSVAQSALIQAPYL